MPILDQNSLVYHFSVPSMMLKDGKEIDIRLNAQHGEFIYLVAAEKIPEVTQLENEGKGHWVGGGYKNVIIKANHMEPKTLDPINRIGKATSELISFYIRVLPYLVGEQQNKKLPYIFNIAFYDEDQIEDLQSGHP